MKFDETHNQRLIATLAHLSEQVQKLNPAIFLSAMATNQNEKFSQNLTVWWRNAKQTFLKKLYLYKSMEN